MVSVDIAAADGLQSQQRLHDFWFGCLCHFFFVDAIHHVGTLRLQLLNVLPHLVGHFPAAGNDQPFVAGAALGNQLSVLVAGVHE